MNTTGQDASGTSVRPPGRASIANGQLKDTPANRALHPTVTPDSIFSAPSLIDHAYYADTKAVIFNEDIRTGLRRLRDSNLMVDCIVTSPPYYGQRDYGIDGQLGLESHPKDFIDNLSEIFSLCWDVLNETGSLWINIGDTYWSGKGAHKSGETKQGARRFGLRPQDRPGDGGWARPKQQLLVPHRLAIALQDAGWLVRNDNVWVKSNPVPDQVRDRCSVSHEYIFHLTKSRWYYFDRTDVGRTQKSGRVLPPLDTWAAKPSSGAGKHRAAFSEELVRIPILTTTPPGGIVLDPFNGSGTSMSFARKQGYRSIGIELNKEYCEHAVSHMKNLDSEDTLDLEI
ncbi:site-specific DNA-methyltransferase (adenine-specific) [Actinopolyspora lacussalsi subsp. righensis]|uniref:Methyltransferase n=2 Tax=Actinopolyspora righensis TaxID=995060 RepID=A0A1I7BZQ0_9ACTN|nr:site-specific DNA-methyltransferase (adenine-specific) [Actinopolyspora righensis]